MNATRDRLARRLRELRKVRAELRQSEAFRIALLQQLIDSKNLCEVYRASSKAAIAAADHNAATAFNLIAQVRDLREQLNSLDDGDWWKRGES